MREGREGGRRGVPCLQSSTQRSVEPEASTRPSGLKRTAVTGPAAAVVRWAVRCVMRCVMHRRDRACRRWAVRRNAGCAEQSGVNASRCAVRCAVW